MVRKKGPGEVWGGGRKGGGEGGIKDTIKRTTESVTTKELRSVVRREI